MQLQQTNCKLLNWCSTVNFKKPLYKIHLRKRVRAKFNARATIIKVCGVTSPEDAKVAVDMGANLIGMIMWPKAKRSVSDEVAAQISEQAHIGGARSVGVFVDEDAETIKRRCKSASLDFAQLHGEKARSIDCGELDGEIGIIYVLNANDDGVIQTDFPHPSKEIDYFLVDGMKGGSGKTYSWQGLKTSQIINKRWLMAGGLNALNVHDAIMSLHPTGVDVSSGVCMPDGLEKDPKMIEAFISEVKRAKENLD